MKHHGTKGPRHVLHQLMQLRKQSRTIIDIVMLTVQRGAWYAFSEDILQTMLCLENKIERRKGIERIIQIRQNRCEGNLGDKSVRIRKTPELNPTATNLNEVIAWKNAYEPLCTCNFTTTQLNEYFSKTMAVPNWSCHAQSIERRVKQVTDACDRVFSHKKREVD